MKRRKKLWIACAALAVVALCALALLYRPMPYEFLRGASASPPRLISLIRAGPVESYTVTEYALEKPLDEVTALAQEELPAKNGWRWTSGETQMYVFGINDASQRHLSLYVATSARPNHPVTTVIVYEPATWIDKILVREEAVPEQTDHDSGP